MRTLDDIADVIRSKNAGIGYFTVDVLFRDREAYEAARSVLSRERVAQAYGVEPAKITDLVHFDPGLAIKITFPRSAVAGGAGLGETDLFGSGQYAPLLDVEVPS
jgi:Domain of unknown function (DUF4387)